MITREQVGLWLPKAYNAALRAGAAILEVYKMGEKEYEITLKADSSPLTEADQRAHNIIKDYLGRTRIPILSEEGRQMLYQERRGWDLFWMVDPLDGTKEFIKGNGEFTVNIALMVNNKPTLGIVYVPYKGRMYFADSQHSYLKDNIFPEETAEYSLEEIMSRSVKLPVTTGANNPLRVAISRSHNNEETFRLLDELRAKYPDVQIIEQGSSYKFCLLAEGEVDYYIRATPTSEWDTAAGEIVLSLAGGSTERLPDHKPLDYNKESLENPGFICRGKYMPNI